MEQTSRHLSLLLSKAQSIAFVLSTNENLLNLANYDMDVRRSVFQELQLINEVTREIMFLAELNVDIDTIYVYVRDKQQLITSIPIFYGARFFPPLGWIDVATTVDRPYEWISSYSDAGLTDRRYISIICRADILRPDIRPTTYVSVNLDEQYAYQSLEALKVTAGSAVFLLDDADRIVAAEDTGLLDEHIGDLYENELPARNGGVDRVTTDRNHLAIYQPVDIPGWGILAIIPEQELFAAQRRAFVFPLIAIVVISVVLFLSASRLVSRSVTQPMETLVSAMQRAEEGELDKPIEEDRADEFGYLYRSYNSMVRQISQLIRDLYQERLLKQEMELQYLQNQVNPHFLYNTLDTINWLAKQHGAADISHIVMALSQLYRSAFNKGRDYILIRDVLESVRSYLYIEQFRYGSVRAYEVDVDERANECVILNLVIQPLVENAVVHGIGEQEPGGDVTIRARFEPPMIRFEIADTGCGMVAEKLDIIRRSIGRPGASEASGLRNVNRRLQLFYGEEYGLSIESRPSEGTTVSFAIPIRRMPE